MFKTLAAAAALSLAALTAPAVAQDGEALFTMLFNQVESSVAGLTRVQEARATLSAGASDDFTFNARAGTEYVVVGVCDMACTDVDLEAFAPGGASVAEDYLEDDAPLLNFTATQGGTYRVQISMAGCEGQCQAAARVYTIRR